MRAEGPTRVTLLHWRWSPQQIAATLKRVYPEWPERRLSHETTPHIHTAIYARPKGELRPELIALLRRRRSKPGPRSRCADRGRIADMVSILLRPPEVDDRAMPRRWEGGLINGAGNKSAAGGAGREGGMET